MIQNSVEQHSNLHKHCLWHSWKRCWVCQVGQLGNTQKLAQDLRMVYWRCFCDIRLSVASYQSRPKPQHRMDYITARRNPSTAEVMVAIYGNARIFTTHGFLMRGESFYSRIKSWPDRWLSEFVPFVNAKTLGDTEWIRHIFSLTMFSHLMVS